MRNNRKKHYNKNSNRNNNKNRNYNPLRTQFDSNGPIGKVRGNAQQIADKYTAAAREARASGDRVKAEELLQYSEHYLRMIIDYRIENPAPVKEESSKSEDAKLEVVEAEETEEVAEETVEEQPVEEAEESEKAS
ncbi:MAG: DUF4167 domain-containing protein [Alphaproteobacteria bacterium]